MREACTQTPFAPNTLYIIHFIHYYILHKPGYTQTHSGVTVWAILTEESATRRSE